MARLGERLVRWYVGAKKRKPGRPRKPRLPLSTAGTFPEGYALPKPGEEPVDDEVLEEERRTLRMKGGGDE